MMTQIQLLEFFTEPTYVVNMLSSLLAFFAYSLGAYWLLHRFYDRKPTYLIVSYISIVIIGAIAFRYLLQEHVQVAIFGFGNYEELSSIRYYVIDNLY